VQLSRKLFGTAKDRISRGVVGLSLRVVDQFPQAIMFGVSVVHDRVA
jgi:hypothetical protein